MGLLHIIIYSIFAITIAINLECIIAVFTLVLLSHMYNTVHY